MSAASLNMDRMYRYQRYIYDFTRKPYLLGRDRMIAALAVPAGGAVLEIACGTGRNLVKVAQAWPGAPCFGLDVSSQMLVTAKAAVQKAGLAGRVQLALADATAFEPAALFGREKFERIFISYSLSMIPPWQNVLAQAATHLAPGGALHVVDFGGQDGLPRWFRAGLRQWLSWFQVFPRAELLEAAQAIAAAQGLACRSQVYYRGYAAHVVLERRSGQDA